MKPEPTVIRRMPWNAETSRDVLLDREWIVTNGLGGYASGSVSGAITRKYHGLLIAALPAPLGRMVMWSHVFESLRFSEQMAISLGAEERAGGQLDLSGADYLREFRLEDGLPIWTFQVRDLVIEKRILLPYLQNTVHVRYRMEGSGKLPRLHLRPTFQFRHHEAAVDETHAAPYRLSMSENRYEISDAHGDLPPFRMRVVGCESTFRVSPEWIPQVVYRTEQERGYAYQGDLWSPGVFEIDLGEDCEATIVGSTEEWEIADVLTPKAAERSERERRQRLLAQASEEARAGTAAELVFAADQFIIRPAGRALDAARAHATGDQVRTIIAGYHWFTDWGRDTMISLEGLTLTTGRAEEAGYILRTFAHYVRDGLIPNMFPDGKNEGLYHTADATLWFFHAIGRYLARTDDEITLHLLIPTLTNIVEAHLRGTRFNIHVDPVDGLLAEGMDGYQLTWMDAKMGDWVVTPRRGKPVEINALWFNALKLLEGWLRQIGDNAAADRYAGHAAQARDSFNARFWFAEGGHLYDVIDPPTGEDDPACRPNQIFAISLDHPVLVQESWASVIDVVQRELLTPVGLRSLSPHHPDYKPTYHGDLRTRDAAYHQGTVWAWLIGPFIDAWLKVHPGENTAARAFLSGFPDHLAEAGIGTISEVFDAEKPHTPRGCIAQAWSVAEVLRSWVRTA